ncbi:hypothetical protein CONPUDRAFT_160837 [Coniophora puteana RWD-64-598 SS2]|uniref:Uncharacterized protein n=1 Tax=Coniophora puteana (strain RWD-64-598) TaxID=741705 RepID=A0A5M3N3J7_CONPW|nr:uncharacterized protein CONPUDRAFT_160837 [Coniophora puteana RWD-64-598 SS2]EIW85916.1 hypothetical protein CONPUDRAFT_160837 [Coniophora puteana RWD-64-598 SS2]
MSTHSGVFKGDTKMEVVSILANCGTNVSKARMVLITYIQAKQRKGRSTAHIEEKLGQLESSFSRDVSLHAAFRDARAKTDMPRSHVIPLPPEIEKRRSIASQSGPLHATSHLDSFSCSPHSPSVRWSGTTSTSPPEDRIEPFPFSNILTSQHTAKIPASVDPHRPPPLDIMEESRSSPHPQPLSRSAPAASAPITRVFRSRSRTSLPPPSPMRSRIIPPSRLPPAAPLPPIPAEPDRHPTSMTSSDEVVNNVGSVFLDTNEPPSYAESAQSHASSSRHSLEHSNDSLGSRRDSALPPYEVVSDPFHRQTLRASSHFTREHSGSTSSSGSTGGRAPYAISEDLDDAMNAFRMPVVSRREIIRCLVGERGYERENWGTVLEECGLGAEEVVYMLREMDREVVTRD